MLSDPSFWVGAAFVAFMALVFKPLKRVITGGLDKHALAVAKELDEARRLKEKAQEILAVYERDHRNAMVEIEKIMAYARNEAARITLEEETKLNDQLKKRTELAMQKITQAEASVIKELQERAANITVSAARALIAEYLSKDAAEKLVSQSIFDITRKLH